MKSILSTRPSDDDPVIDIEGEMVPLRIRRNARARRLLLRADAVRREIRVTIPSYAPTAEAIAFVQKKREWIAARLNSAPAAHPLTPGSSVAFEGEEYRIVWQQNWTRTVKRVDDELRVGGPEDRVPDRILRWLKAEARRVYLADLLHYCVKADEPLPRLQLGDPRSRWGSCSSRGTISLSWRLVMAPATVRRSVIAHEVAHMRHMDHSPAFYAWMDEIYEGDRIAADRWLKMHGTALQRVGR